jgi:pyruvate-formate lyase-activating enzyme
MNTVAELNPREYYRLPWTLTDNAISWLEVTDDCNLECEGCYRPHIKNHKSLAQIAEELAVFKQRRKSDCMSLAGGDPLVHPQIVEIVKMVKEGGWKPIINTNGLALGKKLLKKLKEAGAYGFTFHIDTTQLRSDSKATSEKDHNELRLKFAKMLAEEGGLSCSFNQTVSINTLDQVKDAMTWAQQYPDIVNTMVFILFRTPDLFSADELGGEYEVHANGKVVDLSDTYESPEWGGDTMLKAKDVVAKIREFDADYQPCAYLSGDQDPNATKWLLASRLASKKRGFGYLGPKSMEAAQAGHHFLKGTWMSYSPPKSNSKGRTTMTFMSLFDRRARAIVKRYLLNLLKNPLSLFDRVHLQSFMIIQPIDVLPDGRANMCDGCPDMTVHEGELYWSCRLEEIKEYGCFLQGVKVGGCAANQPPISAGKAQN